MDLKRRLNHQRYVEILRRMTPAQRLQKSFELTELSRQRLKDRLRNRYPDLAESELHQLYLDKLRKYLVKKTAMEIAVAKRMAQAKA